MVAGFGIKNPEHVKDIASVADGIVIGSEIVKRIEIDSRKEFITYIKSIRTALNSFKNIYKVKSKLRKQMKNIHSKNNDYSMN